MKLDEAIKILKGAIKKPNSEDGYMGQALTMAIKALEAQPCDDCISREEALKYSHIEYDDDGEGHRVIYAEDIEELSSVTPQPKWIPVSERLPEEDGDYLVTTKWIGSYSGDVYIETHVAYYRKKPKEWDCVDIIAWMPLPEPYKAESEE